MTITATYSNDPREYAEREAAAANRNALAEKRERVEPPSEEVVAMEMARRAAEKLRLMAEWIARNPLAARHLMFARAENNDQPKITFYAHRGGEQWFRRHFRGLAATEECTDTGYSLTVSSGGIRFELWGSRNNLRQERSVVL